jgi:MFS family permease
MTDVTTEREEKPSSLGILRHRDFAIYWSGQAVSLIGTWMQSLAQGWVMVGLSSSGFALGLLNFFTSLPMLVLSLFGGVLADRFDKRRILLFTQVLFMGLAFVMAYLIDAKILKLWHIYFISFITGIAAAFDMPANQALTPELVEHHEIPQAIALNQSIFHGSRIIGPALAGLLIGWIGLGSAFIANGLSFIAVIVSLLVIRSRVNAHHAAKSVSPLQSMKEGFAFIRERPRLMTLMGFTALTSFLIFPNMAILMPLYAKVALKVDAKGLGLLMGSSGIGALTGSLLLLRIRKEQRRNRIRMGVGGIAVAVFTMGISYHLYLSCLGIFLNSLGISSMLGLVSTIIQESVPHHLRGRVMSVSGLTFTGILPFSSLCLPGIADLIGLRSEMIAASFAYAAIGFTLFRAFTRSPEIPEPVNLPNPP